MATARPPGLKRPLFLCPALRSPMIAARRRLAQPRRMPAAREAGARLPARRGIATLTEAEELRAEALGARRAEARTEAKAEKAQTEPAAELEPEREAKRGGGTRPEAKNLGIRTRGAPGIPAMPRAETPASLMCTLHGPSRSLRCCWPSR